VSHHVLEDERRFMLALWKELGAIGASNERSIDLVEHHLRVPFEALLSFLVSWEEEGWWDHLDGQRIREGFFTAAGYREVAYQAAVDVKEREDAREREDPHHDRS
jgi:hypothetical protein